MVTDLGRVKAQNVSISSVDRPPGAGWGPAHAPEDWQDWKVGERPLCERLDPSLPPAEWPVFAIVRAGVTCRECLEWLHA